MAWQRSDSDGDEIGEPGQAEGRGETEVAITQNANVQPDAGAYSKLHFCRVPVRVESRTGGGLCPHMRATSRPIAEAVLQPLQQ